VLHVRRQVLGVLAGAALVLTGCSDPAPDQVPSPPVASAPAPGSPSPTPAPTAAPTGSSAATPAPAPSTGAAQPQPSSGTDGSVVPNRPVQTAAPKRLDEPTSTAGVKVSLDSVRATTVKATAPGDRSGPGVLVRLSMTNTTRRAVDTSFVQVSLSDADGRPGTLVDGSPTDAVTGRLKVGARTQGTYAFLLDDATSTTVTVAVFVTSGQPVVQFRGRAT
jgi:hypothetical protein